MKLFYTSDVSRFMVEKPVKSILKKLHTKTKTLKEFKKIHTECGNILADHKFKKLNVDCGTAKVFKNSELNLIIKLGGTFHFCHVHEQQEVTEITPKEAIPTIFSFLGLQKYLIRIQPIADVSEEASENAYKKLSRRFRYCYGFDFSDSNVGMFRKKPVLIDW